MFSGVFLSSLYIQAPKSEDLMTIVAMCRYGWTYPLKDWSTKGYCPFQQNNYHDTRLVDGEIIREHSRQILRKYPQKNGARVVPLTKILLESPSH